jgi:CheY-like chemotaxis protein
MKKRILSISYDESLLRTRELILERAGYDVYSALGFAEALEVCQGDSHFDLILMGHSMPRRDKTALIKALRRTSSAPLLSLRKHSDPPLPEAEFSIDALEGPDASLDAVKSALE